MSGNLPLFIIARTDRDVTRYERGGGRCQLSVGGDL